MAASLPVEARRSFCFCASAPACSPSGSPTPELPRDINAGAS